jgi:hypothetical protein
VVAAVSGATGVVDGAAGVEPSPPQDTTTAASDADNRTAAVDVRMLTVVDLRYVAAGSTPFSGE